MLHLQGIKSFARAHLDDLEWGVDGYGRVTLTQIYGIEPADLIVVNDMLEIPAHDEIGLGDGGEGNVMGIGAVSRANDFGSQIAVAQAAGFRRLIDEL